MAQKKQLFFQSRWNIIPKTFLINITSLILDLGVKNNPLISNSCMESFPFYIVATLFKSSTQTKTSKDNNLSAFKCVASRSTVSSYLEIDLRRRRILQSYRVITALGARTATHIDDRVGDTQEIQDRNSNAITRGSHIVNAGLHSWCYWVVGYQLDSLRSTICSDEDIICIICTFIRDYTCSILSPIAIEPLVREMIVVWI